MTNEAQIEAVKAAAEKVFGLTDLVEEDEWTLGAGVLEEFGLACFEAALSAAPQEPVAYEYETWILPGGKWSGYWQKCLMFAEFKGNEMFENEGLRNARPLYAAPAAPALGDLPSRLMGWAGKARRDGNETIELNLETVDRIIEFCSAPAAPVSDIAPDPIAQIVAWLRSEDTKRPQDNWHAWIANRIERGEYKGE